MRNILTLTLAVGTLSSAAFAAETQKRIDQRFADKSVAESPDFQKHISPLMGRLGCNGRACHGSFQGAGGFRLSLFGYDFKMDHDNLTKGDDPRVDLEEPAESMMLQKPTLAVPHKGGKRMEADSWQYRVFMSWLKEGAKGVSGEPAKLGRLEVFPSEIQFAKKGETTQLKAVAVWADGSREDVTPLCRFQSNDEQICKIDTDGKVTANESGDTHVVAFYDNAVVPVPVIRPVSELVADKYPSVPAPTQIDKLVVEKLKKLGVVQSDLSTDAEFLRRVSLDIAGTLPTAKQVEEFLADSSPDKRAKKIDELLETPAYAAWWATWMCDITGNNAQRLNNVGAYNGQQTASTEWRDWIHKRIGENVPYDKLVEGIVLSTSRRPGQTYLEYCTEMSDLLAGRSEKTFAEFESMPHFWARTGFQTVNERALGFAYSFLGIRIQCAECHKHPFDQWSQDDFKQFTGFFGRVASNNNPKDREQLNELQKKLDLEGKNNGERQRIIRKAVQEGQVVPFREVYVSDQPRSPGRGGNNNRRQNNGAPSAKLLGGAEVKVGELADPRTALMDWLRREDNPYFARSLVNRVWAQYFNVGIVSPTDDLSLANPPSNRPLLDHLAAEFVKHGYDLKWLHREITNSRTYQLSWRSNDTNKLDERNFSRAVPRRLPAEVAYDSIRLATASNDEIAKMHRDPGARGISAVGGQRRQGRTSNDQFLALQTFGKSIVESNCDCDKSNEASLLQTIFLRNDQNTLGMLEGNDGWVADTLRELAKAQGKRTRDLNDVVISEAKAEALVKEAYLRSLSRTPEEDELLRAKSFVLEASSPGAGLQGMLWALINTKEFIVNH